MFGRADRVPMNSTLIAPVRAANGDRIPLEVSPSLTLRASSIMTHPFIARKRDERFVGEHRHRETPDPIPNSAVKPVLPMILPRGKVGHRRLYGLRRVNPAEAFFVPGCLQRLFELGHPLYGRFFPRLLHFPRNPCMIRQRRNRHGPANSPAGEKRRALV